MNVPGCMVIPAAICIPAISILGMSIGVVGDAVPRATMHGHCAMHGASPAQARPCVANNAENSAKSAVLRIVLVTPKVPVKHTRTNNRGVRP